MRRVTVTLPDDLARAAELWIRDQKTRSSLGVLIRMALREYLTDNLRRSSTLQITPAVTGSGKSDVSREHDRHFARR